MSKVVVKGMDIPVDQIKPSPYQPRLTFDIEDIKGSIMRDGILVTLTVRKKDGFYEMIDGERRWRVAKELGYETVPCDVIDIDDDTARRMVWKVNTLRKDYEPKEKALFFKRMQEEYGMSLRGIGREYDTDTKMVKAYLNVFKLPDEYQQMVWDGAIPIRNILELEQFFNGVERSTPEANPEIFEILDRSARERYFGAEQIREAIKPYLAKWRAEQIEKAKEALAEVKPEVKVPETPEELERVSRVLWEEARRRREELLTPEEKAKIEVEKEARRREREEARKRREEELKRRLEAEKRRMEEEARMKVEEELLKDKEFLRKAAELAPPIIERPVMEVPLEFAPPPEEIEAIRERLREGEERLKAILERPEVKERGKLFENWIAHDALLGVLGSAHCPVCEANWENLVWKCHNLNVKEAYDLLTDKYQKAVRSGRKE